MQKAFEAVRFTQQDGVATIALSRPEKLNAFTSVMHAELRSALDLCANDETIRTVVLTGTGRAFSSGQDLTETLPTDVEGKLDLGLVLARDYNPLIERLAAFPKVTIAALNGPAVGAAMNIALACDIVVAARSAYLQEAFSKIALVPDAGGTWILPRLIGPKRALALMLTAEPVDAARAEAMGIVFKVFEDDEFSASVEAFAAQLASGPQLAFRLTKQAVAKSLDCDLKTQLALELSMQCEAGKSSDFTEGLAAFRGKRKPLFQGR